MANHLSIDKKEMILSLLIEGNSIRSIGETWNWNDLLNIEINKAA